MSKNKKTFCAVSVARVTLWIAPVALLSLPCDCCYFCCLRVAPWKLSRVVAGVIPVGPAEYLQLLSGKVVKPRNLPVQKQHAKRAPAALAEHRTGKLSPSAIPRTMESERLRKAPFACAETCAEMPANAEKLALGHCASDLQLAEHCRAESFADMRRFLQSTSHTEFAQGNLRKATRAARRAQGTHAQTAPQQQLARSTSRRAHEKRLKRAT